MSENLNDLFAPETEDQFAPVQADDGIVVELVNSANNARGKFEFYPESTLQQVIDICKSKLAMNAGVEQVRVEYNGKTFSDPNLTFEQLNIVSGSKLLVNPSGTVA